MAVKRGMSSLIDKVRTKRATHAHIFTCAVDPDCPENIRSGWSYGWEAGKKESLRELTGDSRPMTEALLLVLRALDKLAKDERQRVLLAVSDLLALDRPASEP